MVSGETQRDRVPKAGMRKLRAIIFAVAAAQGVGTLGAAAHEQCPGNPDALGTSRVLVMHPGEYSQVGTLQYPETLPLGDKEVVLTFDDGPLPPASTEILDTLASQCVKATFFLVGEMAHSFPSVVRRIYAEGHTIGTHSQDHPLRFDRLPIEKLRWEIDQGIANVSAALGNPDEMAPFFRIPGLGRAPEVESELTARSLVTFSVDVVADDWFHHIKPADVVSRAVSRLEKHNGGILLLHDIHKSTAAALPDLLKELKEKGFHIVHVVFDNGPQTEIASGSKTEPQAEPRAEVKVEAKPELKTEAKPELKADLRPGSNRPHTKWMVAISVSGQLIMDDSRDTPNWPQVDRSLTTDPAALPVPDPEAFEPDYPVERTGKLAAGGSDETRWPDKVSPTAPTASQISIPDLQNISAPPDKSQIEGESLGLRPSLNVGGSTEREQSSHERAHSHRHAGSPRPNSGKHASILSTIPA